MNMIDRLKKVANENKLWKEQDSIVLAVSGGVDSMVMLHMMSEVAKESQLSLIVAHVNHGFRPEESLLEKELVEQYTHLLSLNFVYIELEMPQYLLECQGNAQSMARERRYDFLYLTAKKHGARCIATAHHADDQSETVLMNIIRGTGIGGISGIPIKRNEKNMQLIRPLLRMKKDELRNYASLLGVPYLEDSSNYKTHYLRNQIRLEVIPYLKQFNPNLPESLNRLAEVADCEHHYLFQEAQKQFEQLVEVEEQSLKLACSSLLQLHVALQRRLIKLILNYLSCEITNISFESIERAREVATMNSTTYQFDVGEGIVCIREYEMVRFIKQSDIMPACMEQLKLNYETNDYYSSRWHISAKCLEAAPTKLKGRFTAVFDADKLKFPIFIRSKWNGDRMQVLGLAGSKKVQDMFVDAKIPAMLRSQYPILVDAEDILLWVPGVRRSEHALVSEDTKRFFVLEVGEYK